MRYIVVLLLFFIAYRISAQDVLDTSFLICQYELLSSKDTLSSEMEDDLLILQIGKNVSKCYSYYSYQVDSIMSLPNWYEVSKKCLDKAFSQKEIGEFPHKRMHTQVYKNTLKGEMMVTDGFSMQDYIYMDELKPQAWTIGEDTTRVLNYLCQKAECNFRGRHYIAWFTAEIPVSDGPWKFFGLPGLIMEIYDMGKQYHFTITGIEKANKPIIFSETTLANGKYIKTERKKFLKGQRSYLMNQNGYIEVETGIDLGDDTKVMHYDLLERDYMDK